MLFQSQEQLVSYILDNSKDGLIDRDLASQFSDLALHGAKLMTKDSAVSVPVGGSKIGGEPDVPADFIWPTRKALDDDDESFIRRSGEKPSFLKRKLNALTGNAEPKGDVYLPFLCQLNCAELAAAGLKAQFPETGMLYVFYDIVNQPWGDISGVHEQEAARLIWLDVEPDVLQRTTSPDLLLQYFKSDQYLDTEENKQASPLPEQALTVEVGLFPPLMGGEYDRLYDDEIITDEQGDAYHHIVWNEFNKTLGHGHALFGRPWTLQGEVLSHSENIYCRVKSGNGDIVPAADHEKYIKNGCGEHVHLLQFDTGDYSGFDLADAAMIYFNIGARDLANRNFDDAMYVVQSY